MLCVCLKSVLMVFIFSGLVKLLGECENIGEVGEVIMIVGEEGKHARMEGGRKFTYISEQINKVLDRHYRHLLSHPGETIAIESAYAYFPIPSLPLLHCMKCLCTKLLTLGVHT